MSQFDDKELKEAVKLPDLVAEAAASLLNQKRGSASGLIRILLERRVKVEEEVNKSEKELEKKKSELKAILDKIVKLRDGDWSVLEELAKNQQQSN